MQEMHTPEQLVECAYHEAGHAVVAVRLGFKVHGMSLIPEEEYGAVVLWDNPLETLEIGENPDPNTINIIESAIVVFLAGPMAVSRYKGEPFDRAEAESDMVESLQALMKITPVGENFMDHMGRLMGLTSKMLNHGLIWNAVERLAREAVVRFFWAGRATGGGQGIQHDLYETQAIDQTELFDSPKFEPRMRGEEIELVINKANKEYMQRIEEVKEKVQEKIRTKGDKG